MPTFSPSKQSSPRRTLAVLSLAGVAYSVLSSAVVPALPTMQHALHTNETGIAWLLTGYLLSASVATAVIGRLGDMYGKERMLVWTLVVLAAGTLLAAVGNSLAVLIVARVIQGAGGGIFPLAFGIIRDEFPRERVAGSIGLMSSLLGVGGGGGIVVAGFIVEHLDYHWLFWMPFVVICIAALATWRYVPESPIRAPGRINWVAGGLMAIGISLALLAVSETTTWGWGSARTLSLLAVGLIICAVWVAVELRSREPLIDMGMMRLRGVWTTNLVAFLLGGGMYASFIVYPQFAQLPKSTGFGFGASVFVSGLYLLPSALGITVLGSLAGTIAYRFGLRFALILGTGFTGAAFAILIPFHDQPVDLIISATLLGIGIGLAFSALGNLIVRAVPPEQTGVATGVNTVMRTLGGALGGQLSATFINSNMAHGLPTVTGFIYTFVMATAFLVAALGAGFLIPRSSQRRASRVSQATSVAESL
ncbi:MAG TPA: MFS transporter [Solirubrobacteraceae bacterium]|nr:MFS transporter [Solirubrobacteraceae bacterium]